MERKNFFLDIGGKIYDTSSPSSEDFKKRTIISFGDVPPSDVTLSWYHVDGFHLEINSSFDKKFEVEIYDNSNQILYRSDLYRGMYCKLNRKYFNGIRYKVFCEGSLIREENINFKGKRVLISFESSSLGDTLAWIPYCEKFSLVHECEVIVSTFMNEIFENQYPNLEFVSPGSSVENIHGFFRLGWFYSEDMEPEYPSSIPLQKAATNILGLDFIETRPKLKFSPGDRPIEEKYISIGMSTTSGCKEWSREGGWQKLIDLLKEKGYEVAVIQKEPISPNIEGVLDWTGDYPLEVRMNQLHHSEFYIGLGSGLSWLAWSMNKHVVMISNFSEDGHEFTDNTTRIKNESVCHGCWNNPSFKFDRGDWYWCPVHKDTDRHFECHKSITAELIIDSIPDLL